MYITYQLLLGIGAIINSILIVTLYRNRQKNTTIISLITLLLLVNIWFVPKLLMNTLPLNNYMFETLSRIAALGYIFVPVIFLVFALLYSMYHALFHKFLFWVLLLVPPMVFLYLSWTSNLIGVHDPRTATLYAWGYETPTGKLWPTYVFWYNAISIISISVLVYNYRTLVDHVRKKQALYIIFAIVIPLIVATITSGILPLFHIFVFPIGLILTFMMTIIGVSVIYHYGWFVLTPLTILSNINHVIITVDNKGKVIQVNPYSERVLRVKMSHILGKPLEKILVVKDKKNKPTNPFTHLIEPVLHKGKSAIFDTYSILNKRHQLFATSASITPIFSEKSGIIGANIFLRDARREVEREKIKEDYFNMLSHELKTPITSIKAYSQLLLMKLPQGNENREYVMKISNSLDRLTRLINDSLELSRLSSGKFNLQKTFFEVDSFVNGIVDTMRINYKHRTFIVKGATGSLIYADKDRIEQVVTNFITNAIKFSPDDKTIAILLSHDSHHVTIGVKDYGKGIESKYHKRVFDRFFQVENIHKGKGGMGIGLYIAGTIIKSHHGKIWVESVPRKGSTFYFSLPVSQLDNKPTLN